MNQLQASGIRKMFEMASKMKDPINLSLGLPDFDVPDQAKEAAIKAIREGNNAYTVTAGVPELREGIQSALFKEGLQPESILTTQGASGGLILALLALADDSVEVLMPDPYFVAYPYMAHLANAKIKTIETAPHFRLTPDTLANAAKEDSSTRKILLFNTPVNPTGVAYSEEEIKALVEVTRELGIQVISDEVYDRFCYDFPHTSWLKFDPKALLVRTFGKTWGMTGWRTGFVAGPKEIISEMTTLQQFSYVCPPAPLQWGSLAALSVSVEEQINEYKNRRDEVLATLSEHFEVVPPQGAFYVYVKTPGEDPASFFEKCIQEEVLVVPGETFSKHKDYFRLSYALKSDRLRLGLEKLIHIKKQIN